MKFYRREPDAALAGMAELTMAERGAYNTLIDLLYARDGLVPDDDRLVARMMRCDVREWRNLKHRLWICGKVRTIDGLLVANGVCDRLAEAQLASKSAAAAAQVRWHDREKLNEINNRPMPRARELNSINKERKKNINGRENKSLWKTSTPKRKPKDMDRSQRPTYQELVAKHGPNWGINKTGTEDPQ